MQASEDLPSAAHTKAFHNPMGCQETSEPSVYQEGCAPEPAALKSLLLIFLPTAFHTPDRKSSDKGSISAKVPLPAPAPQQHDAAAP